jgi:beta-lactamase regulating signal transducer with metallopeptidase domain
MMTLELALRATALLGGGLLAARALRAASAATRHALWRLVLLAVLLLPVITTASPRWVVLDARHLPGVAGAVREAAGARSLSPGDPQLTPVSGVSPLAAAPWAPSRVAAMAAAWAGGASVIALFYLLGHLRLWNLRRRSTPAPLPWAASASRLASRLGLAATPEVRVTPLAPGPLVCGVARSTILIPSEAAHWPEARRDAVLVHELSHIRRRDVQAQLLAHAVCVIHWFNPLAWLAAREMRRERELACDDAVLTAGVPPAWYAAELLAMASEALDRRAPVVALSMAHPSEMEGRLLAMLGDHPRRMGLVARGAVPLLVTCAAVAVASASTSTSPAVESSEDRMAPEIISPWIGTRLILEESRRIDAHAREATGSPDAAARERATLQIALTAGDEVVPALLKALEDPDSQVREKAAVGLAWRRDPRIVPALLEAAADDDAHVREKVLVALAFSGDARAEAAIDRARMDPDPHVRNKALKLSVLR